MKLIFISLCFTAALSITSAQDSGGSQADFQRRINNLEKQRTTSASNPRESVQEQIIKAEAELAALQKDFTDTSPRITAVKRRISDLEKQRASSSSPRYATRLNTVVRRANTLPAGSIILNAPLKPDQIDELAEDLNVFRFLITRHLEGAFGDQATEYRLGVPITMRDSRIVQLDYVQDFGLLVKVFVPFPVIPSGEPEKKVETPARQDTEWEKARRALLGGDTNPSGNIPGADLSASAPSAPAYDEKLITELKTQMLHALKNAGNLRHVPDDQTILLAIIGAANPSNTTIDPATGIVMINPDAGRSTVLTIRIKKKAAAAAAKDDRAFEDFTKNAQIHGYTDSASGASAQPIAGFGGGYGGYGLPTAAPAAR